MINVNVNESSENVSMFPNVDVEQIKVHSLYLIFNLKGQVVINGCNLNLFQFALYLRNKFIIPSDNAFWHDNQNEVNHK